MKKYSELISQEPVYLHDWAKSKKFGLIADFEDVLITKAEYESKSCPIPNNSYWNEKKQAMALAVKKYENINILFASYSYANYSGEAWVLFAENGTLYEVNGDHCSCMGLEGQWEPEPVVLEELENRLVNGEFGTYEYCGNVFTEELKLFLGLSTGG